MNNPTMAAGFASGLLDYAVEKGADRAALLAASGLSDEALAVQDRRIPVSAYHALISAAIAATGDGALLMRHNMDSKLEAMSIVGQIVHSSGSMVHSIEQLNRYTRLMSELDVIQGADRFEVAIENDEVWLIDHLPQPNETPMAIEASFSRFISEFRRSFPEQTFAIEMEVTYAPPPYVDAYAELLQIPVRFNGARNALRIDNFWLETNFDPGNEYIFAIFTDHANSLLAKLDTSDTTRAKVEARILPDLHTGTISMDKIARDLGMSRQTLYRRLQEEGLTFAEVHDDLRSQMARDYLTARKVSVNETAYLLGFSEASSFVRAFRRWTGKSPKAFREGLA